MSDRLSIKRAVTPRRHSDISEISKARDYSDASGLLAPRQISKSARNSSQSLNSSSQASINQSVTIPATTSPRKSVSFNNRVQLFDHGTWKKQLKRYRKIARKLAEKKEQALKAAKEKEAKGSDDSDGSDDSSCEEEATKPDEAPEVPRMARTRISHSKTPPKIPPSITPPKISIN